MKSNIIQLNLPGDRHQYDWLLAKISQARKASQDHLDYIKANQDGPYDKTDISREFGYHEFADMVEFWIRDLYRNG